MKTSLLPPVRVPAEFRAAVEGVLAAVETRPNFIQQSAFDRRVRVIKVAGIEEA